MMIKYDKNQSKYFDGIIIYFCWNIRKERNRSTFKQNKFAAKKSHNAIRTKMTSNMEMLGLCAMFGKWE